MTESCFLRGAVFSAALVFFSTLSTAAPQFCETELIAAAPEVQAQFGASVGLSDTAAIVGSPFASVGQSCRVGAATTYELVNGAWQNSATLISPNPDCDGQFGYDVDIDGDFAVVGAPFEDVNGAADAGRVYFYVRTAGVWTLRQTLVELTPSAGSRFGHSVSIAAGELAISAIRSDVFGTDAGAVYMYRYQAGSWSFSDRVGPSPATAGAFFGTSVDIFGSYCAVGAVYDNAIANEEGAAYVFERQSNNTWNQYQKLTPPVSEISAYYGVAVSLAGDFLVVGAEGVDNGAANSGSAFVYRNVGGAFALESELASPNPTSGGTFGRAVSYRGLRVAVTEIGAPGGGATHVYGRSTTSPTWTLEGTYIGTNQVSSDGYGVDCALTPDALIVGAFLRSTTLPLTGGAFVYPFNFDDCNFNGLNDLCEVAGNPSLDCDGNGVLDSCDISSGQGADCNQNGLLDSCELMSDPLLDCDANGVIDLCEIASTPALDCDMNGRLDSCDVAGGLVPDANMNGVPDSCESVGMNPGCQTVPNSTGVVSSLTGIGTSSLFNNDILLVGAEMPLNTFGYPIVSRTPANVLPPNAVGFRCVGGSVGRDFGNIFNTAMTGGVMIDVDLLAIPRPNGSATATVGETWYWQLWHRDVVAGTTTSTFTDSLVITITN